MNEWMPYVDNTVYYPAGRIFACFRLPTTFSKMEDDSNDQ